MVGKSGDYLLPDMRVESLPKLGCFRGKRFRFNSRVRTEQGRLTRTQIVTSPLPLPEFCQAKGVRGYPTLQLFKGATFSAAYNGARTAEAFAAGANGEEPPKPKTPEKP